jgi:hypothetical protein
MLHRITAPISEFLLKKEFVKNSLKENVDLSCLKKRPSTRVIVGISIALFSYILGWPVVGILGVISLYVGKPLIVIIGGPLAYGISHLVFLFGMYLAGRDYAAAILKWSIKKAYEKLSAGGQQRPADVVKVE